ncbi:DUF2784 domain-containing protein [Polaromonas sp.]|uniref:DUF2784 domain-containing protein n=1 Tax=Polaromonas sp. TaxID=1869339 RepID=UPI002488ECDD|nr:DUF2784 domain-containing protein [Polaromonas sp.]MDI1274510.1 DUF2784 domain-containing protein [Polaromonas sp.]
MPYKQPLAGTFTAAGVGPDAQVWQWLADIVLALHVAVVAFVVGGLLLVLAGNLWGWRWVNALWFRLAHVGAIVFVVVQTWLGMLCPLTTLELWLRAQAGVAGYGGGFIEHWLQRVLYYEAPWWVFAVAYSLFGLLVVAAWVRFPPGK